MTRIIRIALLVMIPTLALGTLVTACSDDTTNMTVLDMTATPHDMAGGDMAKPGDMAQHD